VQNASAPESDRSAASYPAIRSLMNDDEVTPGHSVPVARMDDSVRDNCDIVDEWGLQSFPASDSPQNW
jgi:hypothetical protein